MAEITSIDVPEVFRMSDAVLDAAGRLDRLSARVEARRYAEKHVLPGSVTCDPGTVEAAASWQVTLARLAEEVRAFGTELRTAATAYREADEFAARQVRASGHPAFGPGGGAGPR
ncbi:hypothetical protein [Paractinoplanes rishiriensis]|uniref:Uncharacterized protein n=1 Tax=Paractinoplanes rishiriensis TaxID=1050105 RepID=A0A919JTB6_9ACTN|nr:hypothetical protein [Actinoplanes rishiriensis]GIE92997.1 hypothetical protein Ari01nite_04620 [Actinoplanes rishiriensis]